MLIFLTFCLKRFLCRQISSQLEEVSVKNLIKFINPFSSIIF
jgi:hypothetical protein